MKDKLYIVNQHYYPENASTGQVFQEIAEYFVKTGNYQVIVLAGIPFYHDNIEIKDYNINELNGVRIKRLYNTAFSKSSFLGKVSNLLTFQISLLFYTVLHIERGAKVMVGTNPPLALVSIALSSYFKKFKIISVIQDLYPDILLSSGHSNDKSLPYIVLSKMMRRSFSVCNEVITISEDMKKYIQKTYGVKQVTVINNMVIGDIFPIDRDKLSLQENNCLEIMYSGNFGVAHEYETLYQTVKNLSLDNGISFKIIGGGINYHKLKDLCDVDNLDNIVFKPYVGKDELNNSLNSADIHIIVFNNAYKNVLMPSKYYGILACGKPMILITDGDNQISNDIKQYNIGYIIKTGDSDSLTTLLQKLKYDKIELEEMGQRVKQLYTKKYSKDLVLEKYSDIVGRL